MTIHELCIHELYIHELYEISNYQKYLIDATSQQAAAHNSN